MKILVSAFDAFNNQKINPTQLIIENLPTKLNNIEIETVLVPTIRFKSINVLLNKIREIQPDYVLMLGQASGIQGFRIERVAINIDDFRIKDNEGNQPIDEKIVFDGNSAYFATLPIKAILSSLNHKGYKAQISNSAGTFVCNHLFYGCAHYLDKKHESIPYGFVHVCDIDDDKSQHFTYSLQEMLDATQIIIETIIETKEDYSLSGGLEY